MEGPVGDAAFCAKLKNCGVFLLRQELKELDLVHRSSREGAGFGGVCGREAKWVLDICLSCSQGVGGRSGAIRPYTRERLVRTAADADLIWCRSRAGSKSMMTTIQPMALGNALDKVISGSGARAPKFMGGTR